MRQRTASMRLLSTVVLLFLLAALVRAQSPSEMLDNMAKSEKACREKNNLSSGTLPELKMTSSKSLKCYVKCQYTSNLNCSITDSDTFTEKTMQTFLKMNPKATKATIDRHRKILTTCTPRGGSDDCDAYAQFSICTSNEYQKVYSSQNQQGQRQTVQQPRNRN
ncbi:uncharacterized protein LOC132200540 [Neocloeon triangulifer]|uniref:uncharacterized protein LOC132200540 n=1 Tax=Neocloeon triangulifer TaxID=2078957 RepID=UPI00286EF090|nr:uncharacterized protein LOC132200540 [Neocloeon triangulifer]